ncbi:DctP family TRAP transporter solute-binding subunit [bacterium]|nr:DctP family TRAP transporter solute-binding subunit [bacterium]MBU1989785.1 DctP family TRAP transporter solute-binding subunit [bacterium]
MKKLVIIFVGVLGIVFAALFIYSQNPEKTVQDSALTNNTQKHSIHLRFGHNTPIDSALHQAALRFASEIKKKTQGGITVEVFPSQELGNDHQMVEMARKGELDILLTPTAKMSVAVPSMQYADLPFYFPSREDLYDMLDGEPGQMILHDMKSIGLIGVTFWENGFKHLTANSPILSPGDLQGKKIRVMKSRIIMEQFKSLGATPLPIDFHSTKQALNDRIVDGQENPLIAIVSMGFHEVQTDLTLSEHAFLGYVLSFSDKSLSKLPSSFRSLLIDTAKEVTPWERKETQKREKKLLGIISKSGVKIHTLNKEQRQEFGRLLKHIPEQYEHIIGVDVISKTKELLYKKYGANLEHKDHILIGINADASIGGELAGLEIKRGVELAVAQINEKGGVLGKPLEVIFKNHKLMPTKGIQNIQEFAQNPNLAAIIGGKHSAVIAEEIATIQGLRIPYLVPWAAAEKVVNNGYEENYIFRISANDALASEYIAGFALEHYKQPAIIVENSVWGRENLNTMKKYLQKQALGFTAEIVYNRGQTSFDQELAAILNSGAESVILIADPIEGSRIVQALSRQKTVLPIVSHWGIVGGDFFQENKKILPAIDLRFFQTFSFSKNPTKASRDLEKLYRSRYKTQKIEIDFAVAQAYDLTNILALAITKAGSIEHVKVKKALENLPPYRGIVKSYTPAFTQKRHDALNVDDFYMAKFHSDGTIVPESKR